LLNCYGGLYRANPWIQFYADGMRRWCQPDGILVEEGLQRLHIVECKYQHTTDAWWQVRHLYAPVLRAIFPAPWEFQVVEVVKWYDPALAFPERVVLASEIHMDSPFFKVHIWNP
jgi:hypothetical protein